MNKFKSLVSLVITVLFFNITFSQTTKKIEENLSLDSGTINSQFEFLVKRSNNWTDERGQNYEVIKKQWVEKIKSHTLDSLKAIHKNLAKTKQVVVNQTKEIAQLKSSLNNTETDLQNTNKEKDSMSLLGLQISKTGYNGLMCSIIAGLLAFLLFFVYKFKNSNTITKEARLRLSETEEDFEEHRKTALEREQKVRRQLQDEINKSRSNV